MSSNLDLPDAQSVLGRPKTNSSSSQSSFQRAGGKDNMKSSLSQSSFQNGGGSYLPNNHIALGRDKEKTGKKQVKNYMCRLLQ
ncbi:hypothetical protein D8674_021636 [Pyrus ussuriensis x Pyrus communis]|uniref:Uncharacterized protein n=1 Tax=Pyrus ussuriensis x Pyrus communis TaxID=2448454 RepID=A0A5N5GI52_9ROSA|nr:hypothetical protein D8674_021636 [Pyrus ussuriensis x Pyrus communis]